MNKSPALSTASAQLVTEAKNLPRVQRSFQIIAEHVQLLAAQVGWDSDYLSGIVEERLRDNMLEWQGPVQAHQQLCAIRQAMQKDKWEDALVATRLQGDGATSVYNKHTKRIRPGSPNSVEVNGLERMIGSLILVLEKDYGVTKYAKTAVERYGGKGDAAAQTDSLQARLDAVAGQIRKLAQVAYWPENHLNQTMQKVSAEVRQARDRYSLKQFRLKEDQGRTLTALRAFIPALQVWKEELLLLRTSCAGRSRTDDAAQRIGSEDDTQAMTVDQLRETVSGLLTEVQIFQKQRAQQRGR